MAKIAVIDDNDDVLFTVRYGIGKSDKTLEIVTFNDPNKFLEDAKENKYDLILLDIMMPQKNGWDTFAEISTTDNKNKDTPIVFLTAKTDKQSQILGGSAAKDYIMKPFTIPDLIKKIKEHV